MIGDLFLDMLTVVATWRMAREVYCTFVLLLMLNSFLSSSPLVWCIQLNTGVTCDVPVEIPANTHMCFITTIGNGVIGYKTIQQEALVLTRPCPTCFPEVRTVTVNQTVPQRGEVCSLKKIWKNPRRLKETTPGTKIVTTPGLLQRRKYPSRILCIWNITCSEGTMMYYNMSQHDSQGQVQGSKQQCPDYIQVSAGNWSLESCGNTPNEMLLNQVQGNEIQVVFHSDRRVNGAGFRLDTTCFQPHQLAQQNEAQGSQADQNESCITIGKSSPSAELVLNEAEQNVLQKAFQIHFQLLSLMDSCGRGVKQCAANNFRILATQIQDTILDLQPLRNACNPVVNEMVNKTLELFKPGS